MSLARFSVRQVILVNLLFIVFIAAGAVVYIGLPVDVYPDTSLDMARVETIWPGASAEDVERLITAVIEDEVEDVIGQERLISYSLPDLSVIGIKFREDLGDAEVEKAFDELRLALDRVTDLPESAEEPVLARMTVDEIWPLIQIAIVDAGAGERTVRRTTLDLKDELRLIDGVSRVRAVAIREPEIHVLLHKENLERYGLSVQEVAAALRSRNLNVPAGIVDLADDEIALRGIGEAEDPGKLADVVIVRNPGGAHVRLGDLGRVEQGFERAYWGSRFNGRPSALLYIAKQRTANAITVRDAVADTVDRYRSSRLLPGVELHLTGDSTTLIENRLDVLKRNLAVGLALVFCVLWMVVGLRNSLLAIIGVPFSFLCAFLFMGAIDVSVNAVSIFSLVLVSGIIVDDAIVVLENIYRHVEEGHPLKKAVIYGTDQVMWPVVSSTLTTIAAFLPLLLMPGVLGKFFSIVPKTVTVALVASLLECLIILPAHYLDWGRRGAGRGRRSGDARQHTGRASENAGNGLVSRAGRRLLKAYDGVLEQVLAHRYLALGVVAAAALLAWEAQRTLVRDLFPSDFPTFIVDFNARPGAGLEETDRAAEHVHRVLDSFMPDKVERYATALGIQWNEDNQRVVRTNLAQIWVDVRQGDADALDPEVVMNEVRLRLNEYVAAHPESGVNNLRAWPVRDGPPVGKPVAIRIEHPDYAIAGGVAERIKAKLRSIPGVHDVSDNLQTGYRELQLSMREARAAELGVSWQQVSSALLGANDGIKVGVFKQPEDAEDLDIKVRLAPGELASLDELHKVKVVGRSGGEVELQQVADFDFHRGYAARYRYNGKRAVEVTADVDTASGVDSTAVTEAVMAEFAPLADEDPRLKLRAEGQFAETRRSFSALWRSGAVAVGLIYLILASQFRSYLQPFVVLIAIVFGVVGMVLGLVLNGYPFTIVTAIAMVALCGVVVNDALILLDFINKERAGGTPLKEALRVSCRRRARPIVLTTVTTVFGLGPMALGIGGYSKIWSPFAMSMCWGLAMATALTLLLVPAVYHMVDDASALLRRRKTTPLSDPDVA